MSSDKGGVKQDVTKGTHRWLSNPGLTFGLVVAMLLAAGGLLFSRPELVLIATPIVVGALWAIQRRPRGDAEVVISTSIATGTATASTRYETEFDLPSEADAVAVRLYERGRERTELVVDAATAARLSGEIAIVHSGPQEIVRVDYALFAAQGGFVTAPVHGPRSTRVISPRVLPLRRLPLPFRMFGLSGGHDSRRPGDGGEFRDISQFVPGDRLRRIDWKVTSRRAQAPGDLYVRRSFATADATAVVMMDSRDEVAELITNHDTTRLEFDVATSLDIAREAASSIAAGYIDSGDRVGFRDLSATHRVVAPDGGLTQLRRLLPVIAGTKPTGVARRRLRAPVVPPGAIVYLLSTFLDDEPAHMAELWRVAGHRVVAVDTLVPTPTTGLRREQLAALRIILLERQARLHYLASLGLDVVHWISANGQSPESQLSAHSRNSAGRR